MLPDDHPIMQHYQAEVVTVDEPLRPDPEALPAIDAEAVRSCNRQLRWKAAQAPERATVYAGYCFRKALQHCSQDERLLEETADLLIELFMANDRPLAAEEMLCALEETEAGDRFARHHIYVRIATSRRLYLKKGLRRRCLEKALRAAAEMLAAEPEQWQPLVDAHVRMAGFCRSQQELGRARDEYAEALGTLDFRDGAGEHPRLHIRALHGLAQVLLEQEELDEAERALSTCERRLREMSRAEGAEWPRERMCRVLLDRAEVAVRRDGQGRALRYLDEAVELLRHASGMTAYACRIRIATLSDEVGRPRMGRTALFELSGTELMLAAGATGYEDVAELAKLEAEDEGASWIAESRPEVQEEASLHRRRLRDAERLLNTDPDLVDERIRGLERSIAAMESDSPGHNSVGLRNLLNAWRALRVIREAAVHVCCERGVLSADWGEGFPADPQTFAGCRFTAIGVRAAAYSPSACRIVAEIPGRPKKAVDPVPEDMSSLVDALGILRDRLDEWRKSRPDRLDRRIARWSFALQAFGETETRILERLHEDTPLSRYEVGVPQHRTGLFAPADDPLGTHEASLLDIEQQLTREWHGLTICEKDIVAAGDHLRRRVAQTLELLADSLTDDHAPELRWCQAPTSPAVYLQWRLGERHELPICGEFYFPRQANTQGCTDACSNVISKLRNNTEKQLWDEAQRIAKREFDEHAQPGDAFLSVWQDARANCPSDPAAALAEFRQLMGADNT